MNTSAISLPLDEDEVILRLSYELSAGRNDTIGRLFSSEGAPVPLIMWEPGLVDVQHPTLRGFLKAAYAARESSGRIPTSWADSAEFAAYSDWTMILSPVNGLKDFRYDQYGRQIAAAYGRDMSGRFTSEIGGHIALFFLALYQAAIRRCQIVASEHEPPTQVFVRTWRRVIVPLYNDEGDFVRLVAVNLADNDLRAGLEVMPDAVMVVEPEGRVCFANRAAFDLFGRNRNDVPNMTLADFTGLEIELPRTPADAVLARLDRQIRHLVVRNSVIVALQISIGATIYRNKPLYIVSACPQVM